MSREQKELLISIISLQFEASQVMDEISKSEEGASEWISRLKELTAEIKDRLEGF